MWNFKQQETSPFPETTIKNNVLYIPHHTIVTPTNIDIDSLLHDPSLPPDLAELYMAAPHWVIQADLLRLVLVYVNGGIYSDADAYILKSFTPDLQDSPQKVFLFTEIVCKSVNELGPRECKDPDNVVRVANYLFGSREPKHPFLKETIEECASRLRILREELALASSTSAPPAKMSPRDILWVCGPDVITTVYHRTKQNYADVCLYDKSYIFHQCFASWR